VEEAAARRSDGQEGEARLGAVPGHLADLAGQGQGDVGVVETVEPDALRRFGHCGVKQDQGFDHRVRPQGGRQDREGEAKPHEGRANQD